MAGAGCIKQPAFLLGAVPFWVLLWTKRRFLNVFVALLGLAMGVYTIWSLTGVPFSVIWKETYEQNFQYISARNWGAWNDIFQNALYVSVAYHPVLWGAFVAGALLMRDAVAGKWRKTSPFEASLVFITAGVSIASLFIGLRFYQTYYLAVLPLLCALSALAASRSASFWVQKAPLVLAFTVISGFHVFSLQLQIRDRNKTWDSEVRHLIGSVLEDTQPRDRIWISNSAHVVYYVTERTPAVKYVYFHQTLGHLDICQASSDRLRENLDFSNYQRLLDDLQNNRPKVIFWNQRPSNTCSDRLRLENFPSIRNIISENYSEKWRSPFGIYFIRK